MIIYITWESQTERSQLLYLKITTSPGCSFTQPNFNLCRRLTSHKPVYVMYRFIWFITSVSRACFSANTRQHWAQAADTKCFYFTCVLCAQNTWVTHPVCSRDRKVSPPGTLICEWQVSHVAPWLTTQQLWLWWVRDLWLIYNQINISSLNTWIKNLYCRCEETHVVTFWPFKKKTRPVLTVPDFYVNIKTSLVTLSDSCRYRPLSVISLITLQPLLGFLDEVLSKIKYILKVSFKRHSAECLWLCFSYFLTNSFLKPELKGQSPRC